MFVEIHPALLRKIATDSERIPSLYYSDHALVRQFFWMRLKLLYALISKSVNSQATCLDFGGGGGVFFPTLARYFQRVVFINSPDSFESPTAECGFEPPRRGQMLTVECGVQPLPRKLSGLLFY